MSESNQDIPPKEDETSTTEKVSGPTDQRPPSTKLDAFFQSNPKIISENPLNLQSIDENDQQLTTLVSPRPAYDVCLVFPVDPSNNSFYKDGLEVIRKIANVIGQKSIFIFMGNTGKEIYLLLGVTDEKMKNFCDLGSMTFLADEAALKERCRLGWPAKGDGEGENAEIKPLIFTEDRPDITRFNPYANIYLKYEVEPEYQNLYRVRPDEINIFTDCYRIRCLQRLLEEPDEFGCCELNFAKLMKKTKTEGDGGDVVKIPTLLGVFPLHNKPKMKELQRIWFSREMLFPWKNQPLDDIRVYFGEKIALYYAFLGHFSYFLTYWMAVIGLATEIVILAFLNESFAIVPFYSLFIVLWGVIMLEYWKRTEKTIAMKHGMINYESTESYRAEFEQAEVLNLTGREILYFPAKKRQLLLIQSYGLMFLFCCCIIGTTACIYVFRGYISSLSKEGADAASIVASILNAIQIQIYGFIFGKISNWMTDRENHETDTAYEDSMIAKNFLFAFINSYNSFFYIAFFASRQKRVDYPGMPADAPQKEWTGQCGAPTCMQTLAINLGIVLATGMTLGNIFELFVPYYFYWAKKKAEKKELAENGKEMSLPEKDFLKDPYNSKNVLNDYLEVVILFGYMTMFVAALPGSAAIVFVSLWLEIKGDAWKLTHLCQRPWPKGTEDIGTWQDVMDLIMSAAVITNAAMIVFTMDLLVDYTDYTRFWLFIGFYWILFIFQYIIRALIPDVPYDVEIQTQRQDYMNRKLIKHEVEDDDEALQAKMAKRSNAAKNWSRKDAMALNVNNMIKESIDS